MRARARLNDLLRSLIGASAALAGAIFTLVEHVRLACYRGLHRRLARRLGIRPSTALVVYGTEVEAAIATRAAEMRGTPVYAATSGTSATPKRLLYTPARLRAVKRVYVEVFCRMFWSTGVRRRSLFVMSALDDDDSLTARLLHEGRRPGFLATLQAPYRVQQLPAVRELDARFGATAVRVWLLTLGNPGILYATNPSTLSTFFEAVSARWLEASALVRELHRQPSAFSREVTRLGRALSSVGAARRLAEVADSEVALPVAAWAPGLEAYVCWTGGYVQPFLDRLARHLPPERYRRIPMYSMSTEAIETVTHFTGRRTDVAFLPTGPGTLHELLPEETPDEPGHLVAPWEAQPERNYTMVVSDGYGLARYQTDDVFRCERLVRGLPDLRFLRRRRLEYSFTGEKLTAEQVTLVFDQLRAAGAVPAEVVFLTCIPSQPVDEAVPHYRLVLATATGEEPSRARLLADEAEAGLRVANPEYRAKVSSGRLLPLRPAIVAMEDLARLVGGARAGTWEAQVKFLPLYRRTWEELTIAHSVRSESCHSATR